MSVDPQAFLNPEQIILPRDTAAVLANNNSCDKSTELPSIFWEFLEKMQRACWAYTDPISNCLLYQEESSGSAQGVENGSNISCTNLEMLESNIVFQRYESLKQAKENMPDLSKRVASGKHEI